MPAPRSPSAWRASVMPRRAPIGWKTGWLSSGVVHRVTGPMAAAQAVSTARSTRRSCSTAAPRAPSTGMSRVLAKPAIGAFARTATATGSFIAVALRQRFRIGAEEIGEPEAPHQHYGVEDTVLLPAPAGGDDAFTQAQRSAHAPEAFAEFNVFHQRDRRKAARRLECVAPHEHRLVAGCNTGEPRAKIH